MAIGTVVIDGRTYQVTRVRLHGGMLMLTAVHYGLVPPCRDAPAAVFGDDGQGVCQSWNVTITPEQLKPGPFGSPDSVTVELPIRIATMEVEAAAS